MTLPHFICQAFSVTLVKLSFIMLVICIVICTTCFGCRVSWLVYLSAVHLQGTAIQSISVEGQERSKNKWAHIQLEEPSQAAAVEAKLNDYVLNGKVLTAKPAGMHNVTQSNMMEARLNMFWHTGVSTGTGFVQFANAEAANDAIVYNAGHPLHGQVLQVKAAPDLQLAKQDKVKLEVAADGTYNGRVEGGRTGLALRFPVRITGLPKDADEITLRDHFQGFGNVASVSMCRKAAPASESDDDDNVMQIKLMSCAPQQSGRFAIVSQVSAVC